MIAEIMDLNSCTDFKMCSHFVSYCNFAVVSKIVTEVWDVINFMVELYSCLNRLTVMVLVLITSSVGQQ